MKKGFTLMEILAVLLVLALILSLAAPILRSVRFEAKNSKARVALLKLAEATKTYYNVSRGGKFSAGDCFNPSTAAGEAVIKTAVSSCDTGGTSPAATGIPGSTFTQQTSQLFACGYLSYKDFAKLPYLFCPGGTQNLPWSVTPIPPIYATARGTAEAGDKYDFTAHNGFMFVDATMKVKDTYQ